MRPLTVKLVRDLWRLRGQAIAVAAIVASGVAVLSSSLAVIEALTETASAYYERHRFGDVFASATRAPRTLVARIEAIPGVHAVEPRVVELATLELPGLDEPVIGTLVSLPSGRAPALNRLSIRIGRDVDPRAPREVVVSEAFAEAHALAPGSRFQALLNGRRRALEVAGVALSPEFVYAIGPGALMPDDARYGIVWMGESSLQAAYGLEGAFNDVVLSLQRGADVDAVIALLDELLEPYGGTGAYPRADQTSNWFLMNEIAQLRSIAGILPSIFLAVAAFMSNVVLTRLVALERAEIGLLKAFGYGNTTVAWHYAQLVLAMAGLGIVAGWLAGYGLGRWTTELYAEFYRFPTLYYAPGVQAFLVAAGVSLAAALLGAIGAARRAGALPPAEAMRPPAPPTFRRSGAGLTTRLDQLTRMVVRQILRWPVRALVTASGVAAAVAVLVIALQWTDALDAMVESVFYDQRREDVAVGLVEVKPAATVRAFGRLPGVVAAEGQRSVAARLRHAHRTRREGVTGLTADSQLQVLKDAQGRPVRVPPAGLVLSTKLAELLAAEPGDIVLVEVLEGSRPKVEVPVAALFETYVGTPAYMSLEALNRALGDPPLVNTVLLRVDPAATSALFAALRELPSTGAISLRQAAIESFYSTIGDTVLVYIGIYVVFACTLAVGVVYNSMRIALSERGRELATLRVLGFGTHEVGYVLLAEAATLVLLGLALGCLLGWSLAMLMARSFDTELFRIPPLVEPSTYGLAVLTCLGVAAVCALLVGRRVARLDLIAVLKTRG
jgi:putative ABC transport system permease protein